MPSRQSRFRLAQERVSIDLPQPMSDPQGCVKDRHSSAGALACPGWRVCFINTVLVYFNEAGVRLAPFSPTVALGSSSQYARPVGGSNQAIPSSPWIHLATGRHLTCVLK